MSTVFETTVSWAPKHWRCGNAGWHCDKTKRFSCLFPFIPLCLLQLKSRRRTQLQVILCLDLFFISSTPLSVFDSIS